MFICKLEGLHKPEGLINRTANRKIIDYYLPQDPLLINYEQTPVCNTFILFKYSVVFGNNTLCVRNQWDFHSAQTTLFLRSVDPGKVTEVRVNRSSNYFTVNFLEFISSVTVRNNFSWANKSEVQRVEEEHNIFSSIVRELDIFELPIWHYSCGSKIRGWFSNESLS